MKKTIPPDFDQLFFYTILSYPLDTSLFLSLIQFVAGANN